MGFLVQILHGFLDPLLLGISTDLLGLFGAEAEREGKELEGSSLKIVSIYPQTFQDHLLWDRGVTVGVEERWNSRG